MSKRSMKWPEAHRVAIAIANKAFSHLIQPLTDKKNDVARKCYDAFFEDIGISPAHAVNVGLLSECSVFSFKLTDGTNTLDTSYTVDSTDALIAGTIYRGALTVTSPDLYNQMADIEALLQPLQQKRNQLKDELCSQLEGKSALTAMKNWPEAAGIISEVMHIDTPAMTVPLEMLLAKFLPMLPAPQPEGD